MADVGGKDERTVNTSSLAPCPPTLIHQTIEDARASGVHGRNLPGTRESRTTVSVQNCQTEPETWPPSLPDIDCAFYFIYVQRSTWDLVLPPRIKPVPPALGTRSPNRWAVREKSQPATLERLVVPTFSSRAFRS